LLVKVTFHVVGVSKKFEVKSPINTIEEIITI